ncbi:uncharacterized protein LOC126369784 [Pectinophora gossypiella]|uniref:uncharacterized protein LOC126369784 n=1 Tax=Pectinophora gossypiella TaxID=13191 RepID=UPI00214F601A|nr:uncharacterized protein LOC126369784 [Pectinophora gossypiella]
MIIVNHISDDMVEKRNKALKKEIKQNLEYERKMQTMDGPWGKPGPGGTTWRNPRNVGLNFSKSMGWTDNEIFSKIKGEHKRYKRSSLTLPKVKRVDDSREDELADKENIKPSGVEKLPDIKAGSPKPNSPEVSRKHSGEKKEAPKEVNGIGNGANGKSKRSPKKSKFVKRLSNGERVKRSIPDEDIESVVIDNGNGNMLEKKPTPEATILRLTGGIELVPLLARRRRVGARTLPSSDVTRPPDQSCQWREIIHVDYLTDLKHQMQVKYERKQENRRDSAESVRRHHETWASLWGKPGHGAPLRGRYARSNLAHLLYVAPLAHPAQ